MSQIIDLGNVVGPPGPKGDKGDKGDKGVKGDKGDKGERGDSPNLNFQIKEDGHLYVTISN